MCFNYLNYSVMQTVLFSRTEGFGSVIICTVLSLLFFLTQSGLLCSCSAVVLDTVKGSLICKLSTSNPELITVTTDNIPLNKKFDSNISVENFGVPSARILELCKFYHRYESNQWQGFKQNLFVDKGS